MEYGRAPDALELADSRVLYWPPTGDRRRLWVYRYRYGTEERYALTGSVTFSLVGTETLEPEQVYAFHCSWELRQQRDPRAPQVDSVAAGQAILDRYNAAEAFVEPASRASDSE